jgi:hypothetical protein
VLDTFSRKSIEEELVHCADGARSEVLRRYPTEFKATSPSQEECQRETVDAKGRRVTWAMRLGTEMHEVALACTAKNLDRLRRGGFSLEPCYSFDKKTGETTFMSCETVQGLLEEGCGDELRGTLRPDVVIHTGDPTQALDVYDFKFPCVHDGKEQPGWRKYPKTSPHYGCTQYEMYREALRVEPGLVAPRWGVIR